MTHPLTNRVAEKIAHTAHWSKDVEDVVFMHDDMRAAADWQLEQVIDWIEATLNAGDVIAEDLKKVMRPQEDD